MAFGFEFYDAIGTKVFDQTNIGLQVVHQQLLTQQITDVTFTVNAAADDLHFAYISVRDNTFYPQNISWSNITAPSQPDNEYTFRITIIKTTVDSSYDTMLTVLAGDAYDATATVVSL
jgi:hypothetical protein